MITAQCGTVFLVDEDVAQACAGSKWFSTGGYAMRNNKGTEYLHRIAMDAPDGVFVDHINGDTRDNRRSNLRLCTHQQNHFNRRANSNSTSKYKGVSWAASRERWRADIKTPKGKKFLGHFKTEQEAARAYDSAALLHFKTFARSNF